MNGGRGLVNILRSRAFRNYAQKQTTMPVRKLQISEPEYDLEYLYDVGNREEILENIKRRKGVGDIDKVLELSKKPASRNELMKELHKIPNRTAPGVYEYGDEPRVLAECGVKKKFDFTPLNFNKLAEKLQLIRTEDLGPLSGEKSYIFFRDLAQMEEALISYSVDKLLKHGFRLISVPDILPTTIIERCGLIVSGERTLVYSLDSHYGDYSLSGTAEMALAAKLADAQFSISQLPLKLAAVSRCYRAEVSNIAEERGLYRVHQFTKVEMFVCSDPDNSSQSMNELREIQQSLFAPLGIHFRVLDMPAHELGAPAYRKLDIEGWLPGKQFYGELSSCSNCTDYQSRRLNIKYEDKNGESSYVHTLNGTACAIPRMLIAICETHQTKDGNIVVPEALIPHMRDETFIKKQQIPSMRDYKCKQKGLS
ncbi:serine--tRNA ligase, mitochondrial [Venturia canescens]|uniref:serine--tRNA ligase, mitochondrial n=1 Tax=Venturia canescens TaxID=32260 RepID=UPI001C9CB494|nr:serine--tRNA ligase, mitochondrial [Venturia canescens]XP_043270352.1 serine--tRNA ligase, mitochondrial [Venturia canescens]XP_043270353.1 serine--tRNA ligase, mitochondrial [Venturia canescens]